MVAFATAIQQSHVTCHLSPVKTVKISTKTYKSCSQNTNTNMDRSRTTNLHSKTLLCYKSRTQTGSPSPRNNPVNPKLMAGKLWYSCLAFSSYLTFSSRLLFEISSSACPLFETVSSDCPVNDWSREMALRLEGRSPIFSKSRFSRLRNLKQQDRFTTCFKNCGTNSWVLSKRFKCKNVFKNV